MSSLGTGKIISLAMLPSFPFLAPAPTSCLCALIKSIFAPLFVKAGMTPILILKDLHWSDAAGFMIFFLAVPITLASQA